MASSNTNQLNGRKAWTITFLLFLAQIINFFDKSVMGLAAAPMMQELGISPEQYGLIASSFFSLYAVSGILVGLFVAGRVASKTIITVLVFIWSLAQLPVVVSSSISVLIASRVLLGIGEGPGTPSSISACHEWFSSDNRNMPSALIMLGSTIGTLLGAPLLSYVIEAFGWRSAFLCCGLIGAAWLLLWLVFGENGPDAVLVSTPDTAALPISDASVISQKRVWLDSTIIGSIIVGFCSYWVVGFNVAWLAPFIRLGLGYDAISTGWLVSASAGLGAILLMLVSFMSQRMLKRGVASRTSRALVNAACLLMCGVSLMLSASVASPMLKIFFLAAGVGFATITFVIGPSLVSEVVPSAVRGKMLIVIYSVVTIAGFLSPAIAGRMIGNIGLAGYENVIWLNAVIAIIGAVFGAFLLQPQRSAAK